MEASTNFYIKAAKIMIDEGVDAILFADDYGSATGLLISPDSFRKHVILQLRRLIGDLKVKRIPVIIHSDSSINTLLPSIVSTGIDGYHPIERNTGMKIEELKKFMAIK